MIPAVSRVVGKALMPTCQQWRTNSCRTVGRQVRNHSIRHSAVKPTDIDSATRRQTSIRKAPARPTNRRLRADTFDALTSKRPYKDPYPMEMVFDILKKEKENHFDPEITDIFLEGRAGDILPALVENICQ